MHFKVKTINGHKYLYIIKNGRIDGKMTQTIQKYVGTADSVYEMLTINKSLKMGSFSFGKPAALIKAAEEVGLIESIDKSAEMNPLFPFHSGKVIFNRGSIPSSNYHWQI